ncbi:unnamed protein product, partial [Didymodactylos carnosus]
MSRLNGEQTINGETNVLLSAEFSIPSRTSSITSQSSALNKRKVSGSALEPSGKNKTNTSKIQATAATKVGQKNTT